MPDIAQIIQSGASNPWLYLPVALVLGALHALEPGHSKSMMAAFIIAVRGTPRQGALLGVSAAVGHTIVVWALAALGLWLGEAYINEKAEPWLLLISGVMVMALAWRLARMALKGLSGSQGDHAHGGHPHDHDHADDHAHPHDRTHSHDHAPCHDHEYSHDHCHDHDNHHDHAGLDEDAHAALHRREIEQRFAGRRDVTTGEILWFGFTGGLVPCPAAIAVLLVCLHLGAFTLGMGMVAAFSVGLALTLSLVGVIAAWGVSAAHRYAGDKLSGLGAWTRRAPVISGVLVMALGLYMVLQALLMLTNKA
jgi:nickel/cobalt exporter